MIDKDQYVWWLSEDVKIDLGEINQNQWDVIKQNVKLLMKEKVTSEIGMAYIASFLIFMHELSLMSDEYDSKIDKFH